VDHGYERGCDSFLAEVDYDATWEGHPGISIRRYGWAAIFCLSYINLRLITHKRTEMGKKPRSFWLISDTLASITMNDSFIHFQIALE
jgi:hypothetical protein